MAKQAEGRRLALHPGLPPLVSSLVGWLVFRRVKSEVASFISRDSY